MIVGNFNTFCIVYEILEVADGNCCKNYGTFDIAINKEFIFNSNTSNFSLDILRNYFRNSLKEIDISDMGYGKDIDAKELFKLACDTRGYSTHDDPNLNSWYFSKNVEVIEWVEKYESIKRSLIKNPYIGLEIDFNDEVTDISPILMFYFKYDDSEKILYSLNDGKDITQATFACGTVFSAISDYIKNLEHCI